MKPCLKFTFTACLTLGFGLLHLLPVSAEGDHTPMEESMEVINDSYRTIGRSLRSPDPSQQAALVEAAATMETQAIKSKDFVPMKIQAMPEADQAAAIEAYKMEMDEFIANIGTLKTALEAGDFTKASEALETLKMDKSEGHKNWKKDE